LERNWDRITVPATVSMRLHIYLTFWKVRTCIIIINPRTDNNRKLKSYGVSSLLNCLRKGVEIIVALI
jgi:hypothetical protein